MDRNAGVLAIVVIAVGSLSARRAWIEIACYRYRRAVLLVALRKESVDRNNPSAAFPAILDEVALRKESVDRNSGRRVLSLKNSSVALRKESVDRNVHIAVAHDLVLASLSARRAWIEILPCRRR